VPCKAATAFVSCPTRSRRTGRRRALPEIGHRKPAESLDDTLRAITARYDARTTDFVAMQLEYPRDRATQ
jgi:hypothetical protein